MTRATAIKSAEKSIEIMSPTSKTQFQAELEKEVGKVRAFYYPVRAGMLRRLFITSAPLNKLHPNPNDEFCQPEVGPNHEIISDYMSEYIRFGKNVNAPVSFKAGITEPLIVEKARPDGYIILNGHHRWAAAHRAGMKKLPIRIVDPTLKQDIQKMLDKSVSDKRVTLDLDETVFRPGSDPFLEKPLPFFLRRLYKERLKLGVPALFQFLKRQKYDIWVYSAKYYSLDYIRAFFIHYRIPVTGIVTGTARKGHKEEIRDIEALMDIRYVSTLHIDDSAVILTHKGSKDYEEFPLSDPGAGWSAAIMDVVENRIKHG